MTIKDDKTLDAPEEPRAGEEEAATAAGAAADAGKKDIFDEFDPLLEGDEDEEVTVKRGQLKKATEAGKNYRTVAIAKKKDGKGGEAPKTESKPVVQDDPSAPVSRKEFFLANQKQAIEMATVPAKDDDEEAQALKKEINDNWDEVRKYYVSKAGKATPKDIYEDILDAHAVWKRKTPAPKTEGENKEAKARLMQDAGFGGRSGKQADGERKRVIPNTDSSPSTWYGEPKSKK